MIEILYKILALLLIISSFLVVFSYNSIYSVLFLILSYVLSAIILLILKCEFIAFIFITIYVGAVAVLFLFVILMVDIKFYVIKTKLFNYSYSMLLSLTFLIELLTLILKIFKVNPYAYIMEDFPIINNHQNLILKLDKLLDIEALGQIISTDFAVQLLIAGLILFLGIIGSVAITLNFTVKKTKKQNFYTQFSRNFKLGSIF